ncbi:ABC transporter substrate-binding protein [Rhizobium sp. SSA_523]|uniref:ABC transporter substrate-binding protein n=1 Tax=Rhizobium sp. SSA_523 TaxID=2952477 RepID=UPI002091C919|nr:ABC transporter substrate-binding protein [Rhizobium sp. SSA_523]MCO5729956.1 ABC transporter substrate-binding protein [Rhizobium sp. SSA_523]WKC25035.1 ABC transporter substrate-binding protein [Rhizobium sp. SSA_523]
MKSVPSIAAMLGLAALASGLPTAGAARAAVIGVVAPQQGPYAALGAQILAGARAAGNENAVVSINETCEEGQGRTVAEALAAAGATIAVGFLCVETVADALPVLKEKAIPAISVSVRSRILMEDAHRYQWPFFRLAPVDGMEAQKMADIILSRFRTRSVALVDDGTIYGRELISTVRQKIEAGGIKPSFVDTFRPGQEQQLSLVRRLVGAGASHVVVGGDRSDVAVMTRDAEADGAQLTFLGGDVMRAADRPVPLADSTLAIALPDYRRLPGAEAAVTVLRDQGVEPEGYVLPAFAAMQVAKAGMAAAQAGGSALLDTLKSMQTETAVGPVEFGADHELRRNPFRLQQWQDDHFELVGPETD